MVRVVELGDLAFLIHQQGHILQAVLGDELAVRFGRIPGQTKDFYFLGFVFFNVLLKLNKLADSKLCIVFGIESQHHSAMMFDSIAEFPSVALLIGQRKIRGCLTGNRDIVFFPC